MTTEWGVWQLWDGVVGYPDAETAALGVYREGQYVVSRQVTEWAPVAVGATPYRQDLVGLGTYSADGGPWEGRVMDIPEEAVRRYGAPGSGLTRDSRDSTSYLNQGFIAGAEWARKQTLEEFRQLLDDLVDPDDCWFDHHGGCQAHGYLDLQPGQICPQQEAKAVLAALEEAR